jgi:serpin B
MALWLVTAERPDGSPALLETLRGQGLAAYLRAVPFRNQRTQVMLPRFGFGGGADMLPALNAHGFAPLLGAGADLRGITGRATAVSAVLHQARIGVDERGTVAAAATAVIASRSLRLDLAEFTADRPFAFLLGLTSPFLPLFVGYVGDAARAQA